VRTVELFDADVPGLADGRYKVTVTQHAGLGDPDGFTATKQFVVAGERFAIDPNEVEGVFPPDLASGEFDAALPHVLLRRTTLPWERTAAAAAPAGAPTSRPPWLAVLLLDGDEAPEPRPGTIADLVPAGTTIAAPGSEAHATGTLPAGHLSYPALAPPGGGGLNLGYGETADARCVTIDLAPALFSRVAPSAADLAFLSHVRSTDTTDAVDHAEARSRVAVVLGNRLPAAGADARAYLVSLEGLLGLLPADDGTPSSHLGERVLRLLVLHHWRFSADDRGETFRALVSELHAGTLQLPFAGPRPTAEQVAAARGRQQAGGLTEEDAAVLAHNAYALGYVPLSHHLRRGGRTVSWYRGPLAPGETGTSVATPLAGADAANRYDPQTGMFDVSYGAAWQLGQLLALESRTFALALLEQRRRDHAAVAAAAEQERVAELLGDALPSLVAARGERLAADEPAPSATVVQDFDARLRRLEGVPFNYLVPDEAMLSAESLRLFRVDAAWVDALVDGAFSIGRATTGELERDGARAARLGAGAGAATRALRANPRPEDPLAEPDGSITGFLVRSQVVSGWPRLNVAAWADAERTRRLGAIRIARVDRDVLLCLFDGTAARVAIRESPEQLHCGVEVRADRLVTPLRQVAGPAPGREYESDPRGGPPEASIPARADGRTLRVADAAAAIAAKLKADFADAPSQFTSAELAIELVKGVVEVDFVVGG
jgi:hypothetical protein